MLVSVLSELVAYKERLTILISNRISRVTHTKSKTNPVHDSGEEWKLRRKKTGVERRTCVPCFRPRYTCVTSHTWGRGDPSLFLHSFTAPRYVYTVLYPNGFILRKYRITFFKLFFKFLVYFTKQTNSI